MREPKFFSMHVSLLNTVVLLVIFYFLILVILYFFQRNILYLPAKDLKEPAVYGLWDMDAIRLKTSDNVEITAWYKPARAGRETIIYFHGNAGHLGDRMDKFRAFLDENYGLLAISYRGYGNSSGSPTEEGLYNDARAGMSYLVANNVPLSNTIIFGESLGSGIAVQMGTEYKTKAVVLEAPYTSITRRASEIYWYVPVSMMLKDKFDSLGKIRNVKSPLLIMHGELDQTIPVIQGRELLQAANEPKRGIFYPDIHHVDFNALQIVEEIKSFLASQSN